MSSINGSYLKRAKGIVDQEGNLTYNIFDEKLNIRYIYICLYLRKVQEVIKNIW